MSSPILSPEAQDDISGIRRYYRGRKSDAWKKITRKVRTAIQLLARQPGMGRFRPELAPGLKSFAVDGYVIFFRIVSGGIEIARIIHSSMNVTPSMFRP